MQHFFAIAFIGTLLSACDPDGDGNIFETTESCFSDLDNRSFLVEQLDTLDISYSIDSETQCVKYSSEGDPPIERFMAVQTANLRDMHPDNFAPGRSSSWGDRNPELVEILEENGIDHGSYIVNDTEWISWNLADVEAVEELLGYSEFQKQNSKETREYYFEFNTPNN